MLCSLSHLKDQDLDQIRSLENELGKTLLAFSCHQGSPTPLAETELGKIQSLEKNLGLSLVAVET
jgi:hypothetical protein